METAKVSSTAKESRGNAPAKRVRNSAVSLRRQTLTEKNIAVTMQLEKSARFGRNVFREYESRYISPRACNEA